MVSASQIAVGKAKEMDINIGPEINILLFSYGEICFFALKGRFQILGVPDKGVLLSSLIGMVTFQFSAKPSVASRIRS